MSLVAENPAENTIVLNVNELNTGDDTDIDGDVLTYAYVPGEENPLFDIDAATGVIQVTAAGAAAIDFEITDQYTLQFSADDGFGLTPFNVVVDITDVNEAPTLADVQARR